MPYSINIMKAIVLFSSGIDSPIAAYLSSKKGVGLIGLNFYNKILDEKYVKDLTELAKLVGIKKLYFADHSVSHKAYTDNCNPRYQCIFCKRIMVRVADKLCEKNNCDFIITGDNIAQVATQTIPNLEVVSSLAKNKILRPLLTFDKNEIIKIARKTGTYEINLKFKGGCPFLPDKPATRSTVEKIKREEDKIDVDNLINEIIKNIKIVEVD